MKTNTSMTLSIIALVGALTVTGCGQNKKQPGVGEEAGAALDNAADKSALKVDAVAEEIKDATDNVIKKTGEVLEKAGEAVDKTGEKLQK